MCIQKDDIDEIMSKMDKKGILERRHGRALAGFMVLDGVKLENIKSFPAFLCFGHPCTECEKPVTCEKSGICYACCRRLSRIPASVPRKAPSKDCNSLAPEFKMFQAEAIKPVIWEVNIDVPFAGLLPDVSSLHAVLNDDMKLVNKIPGSSVFSRVSRAGVKVWEDSAEKVMFPGAKLVNAFVGVTDPIFTKTIRGFKFKLLEETMHSIKCKDDLDQIRFSRTYCKDHRLKYKKGEKVVNGQDMEGQVKWDGVCPNCRGVVRCHFVASEMNFAERRAQIDSLDASGFALRAQVSGFQHEAANASRRKEVTNYILQSEGIIR